MPTYEEWNDSVTAIGLRARSLRERLAAINVQDARLKAQVDEANANLGIIVARLKQGKLPNLLRQLDHQEITSEARQIIEERIDTIIQTLNKDMDNIDRFLAKAETPVFQAAQTDIVIREDLGVLGNEYRRLLEGIQAIEVPEEDFNLGVFGEGSRALKTAYDVMRDAARHLKAVYDAERVRISKEPEEMSGNDAVETYREALAVAASAYNNYFRAKYAYDTLITARQEALNEHLALVSPQIEAFKAKIEESEVLFTPGEKKQHAQQVEGIEARVGPLERSISSAGDRGALGDCRKGIIGLERDIKKLKSDLEKRISQKLKEKRSQLTEKIKIYLKEMENSGDDFGFKAKLQAISMPNTSQLSVLDAVSALDEVDSAWHEVAQQYMAEKAKVSEEARAKVDEEESLLQRFSYAVREQLEPKGELEVQSEGLLERIKTYNNQVVPIHNQPESAKLTDAEMEALIDSFEKSAAMAALLDSAVTPNGILIDQELRDYIPTILTFFKADKDVLSLLCKIHTHLEQSEVFKEYMDVKVYGDTTKPNLLPRLLMLFVEDETGHTGEKIKPHQALLESITKLKTCLLSEKSDAYQKIMISFLYNGNPDLVSMNRLDSSTFKAVVYPNFRQKFDFKAKGEATSLLDKLVAYPAGKVDELAQTMFAFSKTFDDELRKLTTSVRLSTKLRHTQAEVFKALVNHSQPLEGVKAAEKIISDNLSLGIGQRILHGVLQHSEWGRHTAIYQYVESKIESGRALFQDIKDVFDEGRDSPTSVADPFKPKAPGGSDIGGEGSD